ncbi:MAG: molybdopterin cofactor-binding domain-containing protein [Woeseiaceae bacterium]|nr:molybdopterin cofactor-binding domain-containing protein [Woeseiaceae bacterium]
MAYDSKFTNQKFKLVGTRVKRPDGVDKVTGRARYGADTFAPGQLVGAILRSPHAHAKIRRIDTRRAEKLRGVKAVITSADLPDLTDGDDELYDILENCMARGKALYDGHAVAAVAAHDAETARKALQLIKVDYKTLPHVTDVDEAMQPAAPIIQPRVRTKDKPGKPTNIAGVTTYGHGDVDAGFAQADVIIEKSFKTEQVHQGYIEPHACLASVGPDGQGELWVTTQGPFAYRNTCAALLGMEMSQLKVTSSEIGGGFGGKTHVWIEPVALALSRKANRPVKLVMSREDVFRASGPASSTSIDVRLGATRDGRIIAADAALRYSDGAFPGIWGEIGAMAAWACYDIENVRSVGYDVIVNRPKVAAYRAPSAPMAAFAVESTVTLMAGSSASIPSSFVSRMRRARAHARLTARPTGRSAWCRHSKRLKRIRTCVHGSAGTRAAA